MKCWRREQILRALLTDFNTVKPRSVKEIANAIGMNSGVVVDHVEQLGHNGLLRCLTRDELESASRVWQIAHDFLVLVS